MDQERRTIIVQEIKSWKRNKLLPEQYCEFLLNLYRDPESEQDQKDTVADRKRLIADSKPMHWLLHIGCIALFFYVSLHFSVFPSILQIGILLTVTVVLLGLSAWLRDRKPLLSHSCFGIGAFIMLIGGSLWLMSKGIDDWAALTVYVGCCSVIWVILGLMLRMNWVHFCGWAGLLIVYAIVMNRILQLDSLFLLQFGWLPLSFLFGWIGWAVSGRARQAGAVLFILACLLWFAPEAYALVLLDMEAQIIQIFLFGKLLLLGGVAYGLRKTWMEWVV